MWGDETANSYHDCYDVNGIAFVPTGSADTASDGLQPADEQTITTLFSAVDDAAETTDLETGTAVVFSNPRWLYNTQIAGRRFQCHRNEWEWRNPSVYGNIDLDDSLAGWQYIFHPYNGGGQVLITSRSFTNRNSQWQTKSIGLLSEVLGLWSENPQHLNMQQTTDGFRLWNAGDNETFDYCQPGRLTSLLTDGIDIGFTSVNEPLVPIPAINGDGTGTGTGTGTGGNDNGGGGVIYLVFLYLVVFVRHVFIRQLNR